MNQQRKDNPLEIAIKEYIELEVVRYIEENIDKLDICDAIKQLVKPEEEKPFKLKNPHIPLPKE